jgi:hypothetical protein
MGMARRLKEDRLVETRVSLILAPVPVILI